jgi:hypothetical protein
MSKKTRRPYRRPELRSDELRVQSVQLLCVSPLPNSCLPLNGLDCCYGSDANLCENEVNCPPF